MDAAYKLTTEIIKRREEIIAQLLADNLGIKNKVNLLNKIKLKLWGVRLEIHKTNDPYQEIIKIYKRKKLIKETRLIIKLR